MQKRVMGKASFCNVQDLKGNIQCYVARDSIGEDSYADFKKYDVGDIVGVTGEVFKTKTEEISIHASSVTSVQEPSDPSGEVPWPDKYRYPLSSEIHGSDHERRGKGNLCQEIQDHCCDQKIPGRTGLYGSGNTYAGFQRRRCGCKAF